jgi:hypothetical protein
LRPTPPLRKTGRLNFTKVYPMGARGMNSRK